LEDRGQNQVSQLQRACPSRLESLYQCRIMFRWKKKWKLGSLRSVK
jgi:hypothetical protein